MSERGSPEKEKTDESRIFRWAGARPPSPRHQARRRDDAASAQGLPAAVDVRPGGTDIAAVGRAGVRANQSGELRQCGPRAAEQRAPTHRSEEHTSELQSLMRN